jgi:CDP-glucose 4,6-dehydratase
MILDATERTLVGKKILVTGHTGFTGSWVRAWLDLIGANMAGISLENRDQYSMQRLFNTPLEQEYIGNIEDENFVFKVFKQFKPDYVLHLAAQPIVSVGYTNPFQTIKSNSHGTGVILEACNRTSSVTSVVCVTTDKVYKNYDIGKRFIETDELGGGDPYASSKSAAEHLIAAYVQVFRQQNREINVHVARGGNIVGGGDYAQDRLIPDLVRSVIEKTVFRVRQPNSTRPWQHVLSLVQGYFSLLTRGDMMERNEQEVWNFGPLPGKQLSVLDIIDLFSIHWKQPDTKCVVGGFHEASFLDIDSQKANLKLNWSPRWNTEQSFQNTIDWYKSIHELGAIPKEFTEMQIQKYRSAKPL